MRRHARCRLLIVLFATGFLPEGSRLALRAQDAAVPAPVKEAGLLAEPMIRDRLAQARKQLADREPAIEIELRNLAATLQNVEAALRDRVAADLIGRFEELQRRQASQEFELRVLRDVASAWESTLQSAQERGRVLKELETFQAAKEKGAVQFEPGDIPILEAQIRQTRVVLKAQTESEGVYRARLEVINAQLKSPTPQRTQVLEAERRLLSAQIETMPTRRANNEAKIALHEARLAAARESAEAVTSSVPAPAATQPSTATSTAPDSIEAQNKRRLAKALELEARDRLAAVREEIAGLIKQRDAALARGENIDRIEDELQYRKETEQYENRRLRQSKLKNNEAEQKRQIIALEQAVRDAESRLEAFRSGGVRVTEEQRAELAEQFREKARLSLDIAARHDREAALSLNWIASTQESLLLADAMQQAIKQPDENLPWEQFSRAYDHARRMNRLLDTQRQQYDQMMTSQTVGYYQQLRQASLNRRLAEIANQFADTLAPPQPSFWARNKRIFRALGIFGAIFLVGYVSKLLVGLTEILATWLKAAVPSYNFSVKRVTTLASFARSILQLFIWVFGVITILYEFGIDPATSSGAIGLVGLILAGMFQQIVVDFIKGLDIIAGRHYNVGDFVELDDKFGHVIDFSVKYTRIRTLSGQELNIPNSKCIPSRRFPEGYIDNYVDIVLTSGADVNEAKSAIQPVCMYLNRRLEPLKERPQFIDRFRAVGGRAVLRYRVRVLPGCDWVVTDYFLPSVRTALEARGIEMEKDTKFFFINRIDTFRKLFSRQLTEQEILQEAAEMEAPAAPPTSAQPAGGNGAAASVHSDKPPLPQEPEHSSEKPAAPPHSPGAADKPRLQPEDQPA